MSPLCEVVSVWLVWAGAAGVERMYSRDFKGKIAGICCQGREKSGRNPSEK